MILSKSRSSSGVKLAPGDAAGEATALGEFAGAVGDGACVGDGVCADDEAETSPAAIGEAGTPFFLAVGSLCARAWNISQRAIFCSGRSAPRMTAFCASVSESMSCPAAAPPIASPSTGAPAIFARITGSSTFNCSAANEVTLERRSASTVSEVFTSRISLYLSAIEARSSSAERRFARCSFASRSASSCRPFMSPNARS